MSSHRHYPGHLAFVVLVVLAWLSHAVAGDDQPADKVPGFSEHLIKGDYSYSYGLDAVDLDGDGLPDLVAGTTGSVAEVRWWRNDRVPNTKGSTKPR